MNWIIRYIGIIGSVFFLVACSSQGTPPKSSVPRPYVPDTINPPMSFKIKSTEQVIISKACSNPVVVEFYDINNKKSKTQKEVTVFLSGGDLRFFSDNNCTNEVQEIIIPKDSETFNFHFKSISVGRHVVSISESELGQKNQLVDSVVGPPFKLKVISSSETVVAGNKLPSFNVSILDAYDNETTDSIELTAKTEGESLISGQAVLFSEKGKAVFSDLVIEKSGSHLVTIQSPGITSGKTDIITIIPSSPSNLSIIKKPIEGIVSSTLTEVVVEVHDRFGNLINTTGGQVSIQAFTDNSCTSNPELPENNSASINYGLSRFTSLKLNNFGRFYFKARNGSLESSCSSGFNVFSRLYSTNTSIRVNSKKQSQLSNLIRGGKPPYSFYMKKTSTIGTTVNSSGLVLTGEYTGSGFIEEELEVKDSLGQILVFSVFVVPELQMTADKRQVVVGHLINLLVSGGQPPYVFSSSIGVEADSSGRVIAVAEGLSSVGVIDSSGDSKSITLDIVKELALSPNDSSVLKNINASLVAEGGIPPYYYSIESGPGSINQNGSFLSSSIGVTEVKVTDSGGNTSKSLIKTYSGGADKIVFIAQPGNGEVGSGLISNPKVAALNSANEIDYSYSAPVSLELFDTSCSNKINNSVVVSNEKSFNHGSFNPKTILINKAGAFRLKVVSGSYSLCSQEITVSPSSIKVSTGTDNSCVIRSGVLHCWGSNQFGKLAIDPNLVTISPDPVQILSGDAVVSEVSIGDSHVCAISERGVKCWGSNSFGQLGIGPYNLIETYIPTLVENLVGPNYLLSSLKNTTCSGSYGDFLCWGSDQAHQLGKGTPSVNKKVNCSSITNLNTCLNAGCKSESHCSNIFNKTDCLNASCSFNNLTGACSSSSSGDNYCTGVSQYRCENISLELDCLSIQECGWDVDRCYTSGLSFTIGGEVPSNVSIMSSIDRVSSNNETTCAMSNGGVYCWGDNSSYQCGTNYKLVATPTKVSINEDASDVSVGFNHTCSIVNTEIKCWGSNYLGQLGVGYTSDSTYVPVKLNLIGATKIQSGKNFSCALVSEGRVYCWGANDLGQLGLGYSSAFESTPTVVPSLENVVDISAKGSHTCAVTADSSVKCWGYNNNGQIGLDPSVSHSTSPVLVDIP